MDLNKLRVPDSEEADPKRPGLLGYAPIAGSCVGVRIRKVVPAAEWHEPCIPTRPRAHRPGTPGQR